MAKIPCSIPILTLNAEKHLAQCLESVRDFEDVYLVDGNSTDRTLEIAKAFGIPVYKQVETDEPNVRIIDFTATRKRAYSFAKAPWLFDLDSDEYLSTELIAEIRNLFEVGVSKDCAYHIQNKLYFDGRRAEYAFFYPSYTLRLYARGVGIELPDGKALHESVVVPSGVATKQLKEVIWSYSPLSYRDGVRKDDRYLAIVRNKMFVTDPANKLSDIGHCAKSMCVNVLRAVHIVGESLVVSLRHGFRRALPFPQVFRHARYSLVIARMRLVQLLLWPLNYSRRK